MAGSSSGNGNGGMVSSGILEMDATRCLSDQP